MSQWKKIAPIAALSLSMMLAATGCLGAAGASDEATDEPGITAEDRVPAAAVADSMDDESTGEVGQACFGGCCFGGWDAFAARFLIQPFFQCLPFAFPFCGC